MPEGKIIKSLSGFYYVKSGSKIYQTKGRGVFRNQQIKPSVGDHVVFDIQGGNEGYITDIMPRENELVRPPIANIDQAIVMNSAVNPSFNALLLDRMLLVMEAKEIDVVIVVTKMDLASDKQVATIDRYRQAYETIGYPFLTLSTQNTGDTLKLQPYLSHKTSVVTGQSGVGKSSLLNVFDETLELETGDISKSLGRGKHTTRHVELIEMYGGFVADTPGFGSIDLNEIDLQILADSFPEIRRKSIECKFRGCTHRSEPGCAVKTAVEQDVIPSFRYDHYLRFYEEIQSRKPRY